MSKGPDLSAFPIPRKGSAKPIVMEEAAEATAPEDLGGREGASIHTTPAAPAVPPSPEREAAIAGVKTPATQRAGRPVDPPPPIPASSGQTVATTVKLDENRYLRLADAGKPGPGRLKRRTIQEMVIEALDEWFERRRI
jgi:hypothetical protein